MVKLFDWIEMGHQTDLLLLSAVSTELHFCIFLDIYHKAYILLQFFVRKTTNIFTILHAILHNY